MKEENSAPKPRVAFFTQNYEKLVVANVLEPVVYRVLKALHYYFDLKIVTEECDYGRVLEEHQAELALFDGVIENRRPQYEIHNISAHPEIPRLGLCRIDSLSPSRLIFKQRMDDWLVDTYMIQADTAWGEAFAEVRDRVFYWPQFIDPDLFRDYQNYKSIPVLMVGNFEGPTFQYPWRRQVKDFLTSTYPVLEYRHPGYMQEEDSINSVDHDWPRDARFALSGEAYAKTLNAAWVVPTCGGYKNIVVGKHLEIPAARALLITEKTDAVVAHGFRDMENCVFCEPIEINAKLDYLFNHRDVLQRIIDAGYAHVHASHTYKQRPQILEWLRLRQSLNAGEKIVQPDLFGALKKVPAHDPCSTVHMAGATDARLISEGDALLFGGNPAGAREIYKKIFTYVRYASEPLLKLALCNLYEGNAAMATPKLARMVSNLIHFGAQAPDPTEWYLFMVTLLCIGGVQEAEAKLAEFPDVRRTELEAVRWAVYTLADKPDLANQVLLRMRDGKPEDVSMHSFPRISFGEMFSFMGALMERSGQKQLADKLRGAVQLAFRNAA